MSFDEFEKESGAAPEVPAAETPAGSEVPAAPEEVLTEPEKVPEEPAEEPARPEEAEDAAAAEIPPQVQAPEAPPRARPVQPYETEERPAWSEPVYEPVTGIDRDAYTPGRYAYGVQNVRKQDEAEPKRKKEKKPRRFLRAACLVVACAIAAGLTSWAVVDYMVEHDIKGLGGKQVQVVLGDPLATVDPSGAPSESAGALSGNQVYMLACQQVVGVNTSFTQNNIFGVNTPRAVSGSGFIISEDGYILTNYHVIQYAVVYDGDLSVLTSDGTKYDAKVVGYLESNDVAVIKIEAKGLKPVALGDSDRMLVGEQVYAVGNPLGELEYTMTPGIVSAQDRMITTKDDITEATTSINMFQISAAVNAGNSGGPVYNDRGQVIGIVTAKYADEGIEGLGFAIPINDAITIARQLIERGYVSGAGLGITGTNVTQVWNQFAIERYKIPLGVYVDAVNSGSAAEKAGIRPKDIITAVGGRTVSSMNELQLALRHYSPGDTDTITIFRMDASGDQTLELTITFEERPEES